MDEQHSAHFLNAPPNAGTGGTPAATQFQPLNHYENFPVASLLLPARLRPAVQVIYAFARSADDIADEGDASALERLTALQAYETALMHIGQQLAPSPQLVLPPALPLPPLFQALAGVIQQHRLPLTPFFDLLSAFKQDIAVTRYQHFTDLLDYCARSANPVGALMLHLYGQAIPPNLRDSDAICSALQLINFIQDVAVDWRKARIYLPLDDLLQYGIGEADIDAAVADERWAGLLAFEIKRARDMMLSGAPLAKRLPGRIGWELRLVIQGGLRILERIEHAGYDVFRLRPVLAWRDWLAIIWRALRM